MADDFGLGRFWDGYYHFTFRVMAWTATLSAGVFTLFALVLTLQPPVAPISETLLAGMMFLVLGWAILPFAYLVVIYPSAVFFAALFNVTRRMLPLEAALALAAAVTAAASVALVLVGVGWILPELLQLADPLVVLVVPVTAALTAAWLAPRHYRTAIAHARQDQPAA